MIDALYLLLALRQRVGENVFISIHLHGDEGLVFEFRWNAAEEPVRDIKQISVAVDRYNLISFNRKGIERIVIDSYENQKRKK